MANEAKKPKVLNVRCGNSVQMGAQVISSISSEAFDMEITMQGIMCRKAGKCFLIPWQNVNSCELGE